MSLISDVSSPDPSRQKACSKIVPEQKTFLTVNRVKGERGLQALAAVLLVATAIILIREAFIVETKLLLW